MMTPKRLKDTTLFSLPRRSAIGLLSAAAVVLGVAAAPVQADEAPTIRFGAPTWPGVTVKTEVAAQLVQALGFETKQQSASPAFIISTLKTDDLDVYLGGWMPTEKDMIDSARESGKVKVLAKNISGAVMGVAVPKYVWQAGVHTEADLDKHADQFDHKIYAIEPGSGFNQSIQKAIDNDRHGLGDWKMVETNASVMLSQVKRSIGQKEWIVFLGWQPHWMNIKYDIKYLEAVGGRQIADTKSDVLTVVNPKLVEKHPNVARFLKQFKVSIDAQSKWIYEYSQNNRRPSDIASEWIGKHLETVAKWLKGVKTRSGNTAIEAVRAQYSSS